MQRLDETKREAILKSAKRRLSQYGVRKTTMQDIAEDTGIAVGTLYLYFKNKNEILVATAESYSQQHIEETEDILRSPITASAKLKTYLLSRFRAVKEYRLGGSHAAELTRAVIRLRPELKQKEGEAVRENVHRILRYGIETNELKIQHLEKDLDVFLFSIGYFFPMPTTENYYEPEEEQLCLVIEWFLQQWS